MTWVIIVLVGLFTHVALWGWHKKTLLTAFLCMGYLNGVIVVWLTRPWEV